MTGGAPESERDVTPVRWRKLGLIFRPDPTRTWMHSHAALPVVFPLGKGRIRVYFSSRDDRNRSHIGYFEISLDEPRRIMSISESPVLAPGPLGYFDDHGVYASSLVEAEGALYLYYVGWNPGPPPLFYPSIGLATSCDGGRTFERASPAPILARSDQDPWMVSAPFVLREGERWRMWYISGLGWEQGENGLWSRYHIKMAESTDGVRWVRDGHIAIPLAEGESNVSRMCVLRDGSRYAGWYGYCAGHEYRIGYAVSTDGRTWDRLDRLSGLTPSESQNDFDSAAVEYPYVVVHNGRRFMFYNGNRFGADGIGLAVDDSRAPA